jgi:glycosyltransferase involved in cell wall biosynthesis
MVEGLNQFPGRLALQQRVLPAYRVDFFDALAAACRGGLSVFAGQPQPGEQIATSDRLSLAKYFPARNRHFLKVSSPFYRCWQDGWIEWLEGWQPDALIVEANPRYLSTHLAVRWMHDRGLPVLGWGLGVPPVHGFLSGWRSQARLQFLGSLDGLIAYSQRGAEEYRSLAISPERVFVAPNAVCSRPSQPPPNRPMTFPDRPVVLFVGRLQARKRLDNLLHACAALPTELRPRVWIVGDGPERKALQDLAEEIYPGAEFAGARYGEELAEYFRAADLFVLPGTGGLAIQQAMSFGLPVIAAEGDGTQDDLVTASNGWRIPPDDLSALVETLNIALSESTRLRRMGKESYRIVAEEANLEKMVAVFLEALACVSRNATQET